MEHHAERISSGLARMLVDGESRVKIPSNLQVTDPTAAERSQQLTSTAYHLAFTLPILCGLFRACLLWAAGVQLELVIHP